VLTPEQLARLQAMIDERHVALELEIRGDAARSRDEPFSLIAGPVADSGDSATADVISDLDNAELSRDLQEFRALETAQDRLARGTYESCVDCGVAIGFERLLAQPTALRCLACQKVYEKTHAHAPRPTL
jgi:DnaK suppressor protein